MAVMVVICVFEDEPEAEDAELGVGPALLVVVGPFADARAAQRHIDEGGVVFIEGAAHVLSTCNTEVRGVTAPL